jgi:adenylosuccinate synthase
LFDAALRLQKEKQKTVQLSGIGPTYMDKPVETEFVGDIEMEDFKERYRATANKRRDDCFYDVIIHN